MAVGCGPMARNGLNCTFAYTDGTTTHTYSVRAGELSHGVQMVAGEDAARVIRAYYPHRSASQRFTVQVLLKDWDERTHFTSWLASYAQWAIDPSIARTVFPFINVRVPGRGFYQTGMPVNGFEWGAHAGMMMFTPVIVFETGLSPGQVGTAITVSSVVNKWAAFASDPAIQYFYPFGAQLASNQVPENYTQVVPPSPVPPPVTSSPGGQPIPVGGPVVTTVPPPLPPSQPIPVGGPVVTTVPGSSDVSG